MKRLKSVLLGALTLCMLLALCACGGTTTEESPSAASPDVSTSADSNTADGGELVMATNAEFPPYEYHEGGEIIGIDVEIAQAIAEKLGKTLKIEDMNFDSVIAAVQTGKADIGVAGLSVTEDRLVNVDFTDTYATTYQVIIVKEDSTIAAKADLKDKTIGVQENTTGDLLISDDEELGDVVVDRYKKGTEAVQALLQNKADAVVIDQATAEVFVQQTEGLKILPTEYTIEHYAIAVAKDNTELKDSINEALNELKESGELQEIVDKYISAE